MPVEEKPQAPGAVTDQVAPPVSQAATEDEFAPTHWGSTQGGAEKLVMPSGQKALVMRPGPEGLIQAGLIQSLDSLTGIVQNELIPAAEGTPKIDAKKIISSKPSALVDMMHTVDRVVCHVVVKPDVQMTPNDITRREPGVIYTDMIELSDKMFIFNFALGGTRDVETFRQESQALVGSVDPGEVPADPA